MPTCKYSSLFFILLIKTIAENMNESFKGIHYGLER